MNRHYYISDDLDDLEAIKNELEAKGVSTPQIHVLSLDDAGVEGRDLHQVPSLMKNDAVRSAAKASIFGLIGAALVLFVAHLSGLTASIGWMPFVFLAVVVLGFVTWEGGMWGVQEPNVNFVRFQKALDAGKHVLYVEVKDDQEAVLKSVTDVHPRLEDAGVESAATDLLIGVENGVMKWAKWGP